MNNKLLLTISAILSVITTILIITVVSTKDSLPLENFLGLFTLFFIICFLAYSGLLSLIFKWIRTIIMIAINQEFEMIQNRLINLEKDMETLQERVKLKNKD
ncbi:hypothetical protein CYQ88_08405 [Hydrogenovibrio sp. SC-1]|nr:hypothetical protein CYQ88_08405 [Hydrogenovibrio sp. SC-1]